MTASSSVTLTLNHDIREQTAYNLTDFMLNYIVKNNLPKSITVGDCMSDPAENWYRDAGGIPKNMTSSASSSSSSSGSSKKKSSSSALIVDQTTLFKATIIAGVLMVLFS